MFAEKGCGCASVWRVVRVSACVGLGELVYTFAYCGMYECMLVKVLVNF